MLVTGIGRDRLPYTDYFFAVRAPEAADGSEALSLQSLTYMEIDKTVSITGTVMNRTESPISGLLAVIAVTDKFTLPVQTVNVPVEPAELAPKAMGTFRTTVTLGENGFGGYTLQFRLPDDGPFVPHKDERPPEPLSPQSPVPQSHPARLETSIRLLWISERRQDPRTRRLRTCLGRALLSRNIGLVYGGGGVGMMGRISETVKNGGGEIIGIIPNALLAREVGRGDIGELRIVRSMHERKAMMVEISDGFIALPGGFGTFEEFCEIVTWAQLGLHSKPVGLLNVDSYFDPLIEQFDRAVAEEFAYPENRRLILHESDPDRLLDLMESYKPPNVEQWIDPDEA